MAEGVPEGAKGQGKGSALRAPPRPNLTAKSRTGSNISLTPRAKLFLGQATPLALACQKPDGHFEVRDLLSRWRSRIADQNLKEGDDYTATVLCLTMSQMMIDRTVRRLPDAQMMTLQDLYAKQFTEEWASSLKMTWDSASPLGEAWYAKAEEWLSQNAPAAGKNRHVIRKELEVVLAEAFLQKGEIDLDMEKNRLRTLREAQVGMMNFDDLKPATLREVNWKQAKKASYLEDASVVIVELADHKGVVIGGNTRNAVNSVAAKGILTTLKVKHVNSKIIQPMGSAEREEMIRSVVNVVDGDAAPGVIEFLTGRALSKADFGLSAASSWKREVLFVGELSTACKQPLVTNEVEDLTQAQLEDIGIVCAVDLLFNNTQMLCEQIGLTSTNDGLQVTSMIQVVNAEPDGLKRNAYMGQLTDILTDVFTESKPDAIKRLQQSFYWGDASLSEDQLSQVLAGMQEGLKRIAAKTWTKDNLTKLINKTFRTVKEDVGMSNLDEIMEFLVDVQDAIEEVVEGRHTIVGMCGVRSIVSNADLGGETPKGG